MEADGDPWQVESEPSARRQLSRLPEKVAAAVLEFAWGPLRRRPTIVGKPLRWELEGHYAARRGTWRIIYTLDVPTRTVIVTQVAHRAHAYD